jgi:hypothetical protein
MIFPTVEFAVFFALVLVTSWILMPRRAAWKLFILAASYTFYGFSDYRWCLLLLGSTVFNQLMAELIHRAAASACGRGCSRSPSWATWRCSAGSSTTASSSTPVAGTLSAVGLRPATAAVAGRAAGRDLVLHLPGAQLRHRRAAARARAGRAGGLRRLPRVLPAPGRRPDRPRVGVPAAAARAARPARPPAARAFRLIVGGLIKKVVIADVLASSLVDSVFTTPGQHSRLEILVGIYGYAVQIYCDFSAYSDIAIGVALLLGFRFPENFNAPYAACRCRTSGGAGT